MQLKKLKLKNFKNYASLTVNFHEKINIVTGLNGSGKTNLIDGIYYLCSCKSYFQSSDKAVVKHEQDFFTASAEITKGDENYNLSCKYSLRKKKEFECNRQVYEKLAEHIGKFPVSIITPDDIQIVKAGSEFRRKLTDHTLSQFDFEYLKNLIRYNKILQQRNAYLKQLQAPYPIINTLLDSYDFQLLQFSEKVYNLRSEIMEECSENLIKMYELLSGGREEVSINYKSNLQAGNLLHLLKNNRTKDQLLRRTTVGIHKDDWEFKIGEYAIKKIGSQGQQKSFLIALKLAFYHLLSHKKNELPILLLDDIFDKLDANRIKALIKIITEKSYGQVFITDADNERLPTILNELNLQFNHYVVEDNLVTQK
ncbi:UNVERIFIED_CONTAM: hypothetical protein GTU68_002854 [Idotea baltica]|nr:hypothetical protein [Idotea baltica]